MSGEARREASARPTLGADLTRRQVLGLLGAAPLGALLDWDAVGRARRAVDSALAAGVRYQPRFFTPQEWRTVRVLMDLIIPRDERSGSATDAGVPEFVDFVIAERVANGEQLRSGLGWLDRECGRRFARPFAECEDAERSQVLDDIAYPARARPEMQEGVQFFTRMRDFTASGFWSSRMGVEDLRYLGNVFVPEWTGCPEEQLRRLGVSDDR